MIRLEEDVNDEVLVVDFRGVVPDGGVGAGRFFFIFGVDWPETEGLSMESVERLTEGWVAGDGTGGGGAGAFPLR